MSADLYIKRDEGPCNSVAKITAASHRRRGFANPSTRWKPDWFNCLMRCVGWLRSCRIVKGIKAGPRACQWWTTCCFCWGQSELVPRRCLCWSLWEIRSCVMLWATEQVNAMPFNDIWRYTCTTYNIGVLSIVLPPLSWPGMEVSHLMLVMLSYNWIRSLWHVSGNHH